MMKHGVENEELQAYLDGELTPARQAEVEAHLGQCAECAAVVDDLERVSAALQRWTVEPAPAGLRPPTVPAEAPEKPRWFPWSPVWAYAGVAAMVLVVGLVSVDVLYRSRIEPLPEPSTEKHPMVLAPYKLPTDHQKQEGERAPQDDPSLGGYRAPAAPQGAESYRVAPAAPAVLEGIPAEPSRELQRRDLEADEFALKKKVESEDRQRELADRAAAPAPERKEVVGGAVGGRLAAQSQAAPTSAGEAAEVEKDLSDRVSTVTENKEELARNVAAGQLAQPEGFAASEGAAANRLRAKTGVLQLIAYQVSLTVEVKEFGEAKEKVEQVVAEAGGYLAQALSQETPDQPQRADLTVRVPVEQLSAVLEKLRGLGRVQNEQISSEEVTDQVVDLEARLRNARATEQRLIQVLNERTGKVRDILEVEREIARTRQEIERMDAQRQNLLGRAEMATLQVTLIEEFQARLDPAPVGTATRLRNAFVEGYESFVGTLLGFAFFFAHYGLNLLFWFGLLWLTWRGIRRTVLRRFAVPH